MGGGRSAWAAKKKKKLTPRGASKLIDHNLGSSRFVSQELLHKRCNIRPLQWDTRLNNSFL